MFSFIKKFFKTEKESINFNEIENWLKNKSENIETINKEKTEDIKQNIAEEIEKTKENLTNLENAELRNKNISEKELQFMQGNREAYVKRTNLFLSNINIDSIDFQDFETQISGFSKSTIRPYSILQNFFANESSMIVSNIRNINSMMNELKTAAYRNELEKNKNNLKEKQQYIDELNEKIKIIKKGKEFRALQKDKEKREQIISQIKQLKEKLYNNFSIIEKSMKKYSRISLDEKQVNEYIATPFKALLKDNELEIIEILSKLRQNIEQNKIELKDKKQEKTLETINNLNKEFFENILANYYQLDKELDNINQIINTNDISFVLEKQNKALENLNSEIEKIKNMVNNNEIELNKIDIAEMEKELKETINKDFGLSVKS